MIANGAPSDEWELTILTVIYTLSLDHANTCPNRRKGHTS